MPERTFPGLVRKLEPQEPQIKGRRLAAVSVILSDRVTPKILLIKKSERSGDPWSGQIAFPGGKFQKGDASARSTAVREAREEVGIDLDLSAEFLGYFGSFETHTAEMKVVPVLFLMKESTSVRINEEATSYMWADLQEIASNEAKIAQKLPFENGTKEVPAFKVGDYVVWGLTYRIISSLMEGISA